MARVEADFDQIGGCLQDKRKRESFAMYACGILGEGERKSAEPIAARACGCFALVVAERVQHLRRADRSILASFEVSSPQ